MAKQEYRLDQSEHIIVSDMLIVSLVKIPIYHQPSDPTKNLDVSGKGRLHCG
jgi:hypothetical protein